MIALCRGCAQEEKYYYEAKRRWDMAKIGKVKDGVCVYIYISKESYGNQVRVKHLFGFNQGV